jgi:Zn-dependent protease
MADHEERIVARIGTTPVTVKGLGWIPLVQLAVWGIFWRGTARRHPDSPPLYYAGEGFLKMAVTLGSEWCHNLAHAVVSNIIGKPMDRLRIQFGMPRCLYENINDTTVTPRQHIARSLGGPLINMVLLPVSGLICMLTRKQSLVGRTAAMAYKTNLFLSLISLLPIPGIDGGPILKWSLVEQGRTTEEADRVVQQVNGPLAVGLGLYSSQAFARKKILAGSFSAMLGLISLSIFAGWLKEEDVPA